MKPRKKRKAKPQSGYAVIEFNHDGISDEDIKPEEFDEQQLAVLAALRVDQAEKIRKGYPAAVVQLSNGKMLAGFNRHNIVLTEYQKEALARSTYEAAMRFYSDPENVKKFEEQKKKREAEGKI